MATAEIDGVEGRCPSRNGLGGGRHGDLARPGAGLCEAGSQLLELRRVIIARCTAIANDRLSPRDLLQQKIFEERIAPVRGPAAAESQEAHCRLHERARVRTPLAARCRRRSNHRRRLARRMKQTLLMDQYFMFVRAPRDTHQSLQTTRDGKPSRRWHWEV